MKNGNGYFPICLPAEQNHERETHGQGWQGETVEENIELCKYQTIEPVFRKFLPKQGKILEAGCGLGRWVFYLRQLSYDITGIDLSDTAVRLAKEFDPDAQIDVDDVLHTRYADRSFDAVISLGVVEHFEDGPQLAFREARRVLKEDGLFFVAVPFQNMFRKLVIYQIRRLRRLEWALRNTPIAFEEYHYGRDRIMALLHESQFEVIDTIYDDFKYPKNMAMYADSRFFRSERKWELNSFGQILDRGMRAISPWFNAAGILCVCRKSISASHSTS